MTKKTIVLILFVCLFMPCTPLAAASEDNLIQLAAVQMQLDLDDFWSPEAFENRIQQIMERIHDKLDPSLPALVAFPEDVGLMLMVQGMEDRLSNVETIAEAIESATRAYFLQAAWTRLIRQVSWVPALYLHRHKDIAEPYFQTFSHMANTYNVYIVAGSVILPPYPLENGLVDWSRPLEYQVHNTSYLFGPDGSILGKQDKMYLIDLEREAALDLTPGAMETLNVMDTSLGRIGIAICLDAFRDDVVDSLVAQGAEILVQPSANPAPWHQDQQQGWMCSAYEQTVEREKFVYAINPMLNGPLWDIAFFGQSSIVTSNASLGQSLGYRDLPKGEGFLAVARTHDQEEILVVTVPHPSSP